MKAIAASLLLSLLFEPAALAAGPPVATQSKAPAPAIPEPAAFALFVLGAGVLGVTIRRRES